ncbi:hypothetical protein [Marinovum sp. PR37]|uniref:hypothetical protein n=1 Tax=Marinovum sp. PR37 TaxID=3028382 RepID=UPI00237B8729|nr:hypothetical protein [Marinovum sp. PR37]MDD9743216.1 hypothetical protein [Marinovum sp. PR37]
MFVALQLIGVGLMVGGTGYLVYSVQVFALPEGATLEAVKVALLMVVTAAELSFALMLILRGPRPSTPHAVQG